MRSIHRPLEASALGVEACRRPGPCRWRHAGAVALLALTALGAAAQTPPDKSLQELRAFYQQQCSRCHGPDGSARSADGRKLAGRDFTLSAKEAATQGGPASDREIRSMVRTIQKGIFFGLTMPGWKDQLSEADATRLVREVLLKAEAGRAIAPGSESAGPR